VGNAAEQFQLDVWGEVLDGLHLSREAGISPMADGWDVQRALLDFLEGHWQQPDNGLWKVRGRGPGTGPRTRCRGECPDDRAGAGDPGAHRTSAGQEPASARCLLQVPP
jgi:hypothetical protein